VPIETDKILGDEQGADDDPENENPEPGHVRIPADG
jgi:hypothetical protein